MQRYRTVWLVTLIWHAIWSGTELSSKQNFKIGVGGTTVFKKIHILCAKKGKKTHVSNFWLSCDPVATNYFYHFCLRISNRNSLFPIDSNSRRFFRKVLLLWLDAVTVNKIRYIWVNVTIKKKCADLEKFVVFFITKKKPTNFE